MLGRSRHRPRGPDRHDRSGFPWARLETVRLSSKRGFTASPCVSAMLPRHSSTHGVIAFDAAGVDRGSSSARGTISRDALPASHIMSVMLHDVSIDPQSGQSMDLRLTS